MQLSHLRVKNFRALKDVSIDLSSYVALIGGNGAGKSSILKAIEKFYTSKPLEASDYFGGDHNLAVEIEATFSFLSSDELEIFSSRVRDGRLVVTKVFDDNATSGRYFGSVLQNPLFVSIRQQQSASGKLTAYRQLRSDNVQYRDELPAASSAAAAEEALIEWERANPGSLQLLRDDGQFFGFQNASRGALKRYTSFVFIPAVREASADAADGKSSAIGQLLEIVVRSAILQRQDIIEFRTEMLERYQRLVAPDQMPELGRLASRLTADLKSLYRDAEVGLEWRNAGDFPFPLPTADVFLNDDGFGGPVDRQGHGLQRAFVLTLLQHLARITNSVGILDKIDQKSSETNSMHVAQPPSLILAIEEPELYQHPTKQRHFASVLRSLSAGMLPGIESPTQIIFGSHSPMFVSMENSDEIRLVKKVEQEGSLFKHCDIRSLNLNAVAKKIEAAWGKQPGSYSGSTLKPHLHILGSELSEGFFANGIVLVEGRSDKAALHASIRMFRRNFEEAGIAVLSAEGKGNLDKPYAIFRELGIPVYLIWDCDLKEKNKNTDANLALLRLVCEDNKLSDVPQADIIKENYAYFLENLDVNIKSELTSTIYDECLKAACTPFDIVPSKESQKIPEVMFRTLLGAKQKGFTCLTLNKLVKSIWQYMTGETLTDL